MFSTGNITSNTEAEVLEKAQLFKDKGWLIYTVALGTGPNDATLRSIASLTGGRYYNALTADKLSDIYLSIEKGTISGSVFDDINGNGTRDQGEPAQFDWPVYVYSPTNQLLEILKTNPDGSYSFNKFCADQTYTLKAVQRPGWRQTLPVNNGGYTVAVTRDSVHTDKNFGFNLLPTPTPEPNNSPVRRAKPAVWRAGTWFLRNSLTSGPAELSFTFGNPSDKPIMCDWDGNGTRTPGVFRDGTWYLRNTIGSGNPEQSFTFGQAGDIPVCGDWNNDGRETVGVRRSNTWLLRNTNAAGNADITFTYGLETDNPVTGDWNGTGNTTPGVFRNANWFLKNSNTAGNADLTFPYGTSDDVPIVGDWNGDKFIIVGVV
jgi:hypothetical protein